ncbi:MAG: glycosyltransferase family 2 protein [Pseudomonadota bacterium]
MTPTLEFSVIVPVFNEAGNVARLVEEISSALDGRAYEMIFIDDASTDETRLELTSLKDRFPTLRVLRHRANAGQSRALRTGVMAARGRVIGTLDGDGQNDPQDLPELFRQLTRADAPSDLGLVMGFRAHRRDTIWKRIASRAGNGVRRWILKDDSFDSACGIKVVYRDLFLAIPYFDHMHRYMPALAMAEGRSVETRPVNHRPRDAGRSKYTNIGRLFDGFGDLNGVAWLLRRRRQTGGVDEI